MAYGHKQKLAAEAEELTKTWIAVTKYEEPEAFAAWCAYNWYAIGMHYVPERAWTVPSLFPPETRQAARDYIAGLTAWRKANDWHESRGSLKRVLEEAPVWSAGTITGGASQ